MYSYLARQPILDKQLELYGYELLFRASDENCYPNVAPDEATSKLLANSHLDLGIESIAQGKKAFINFHEESLLYRFATSIDPQNVVVELLEDMQFNSDLLTACINLKAAGYTLALDDYDFAPQWQEVMPYIDIVKIDILATDLAQYHEQIQQLKALGKVLIAEKVESREQFEQYHALGFDLFQGYFFAVPEIIKHKKLGLNKLNLIELIAEVGKPDLDFSEVNQVISRDVTLTYKLLRYINCPLVNKRQTISSIDHAVRYMGEIEVKKFVALLALANIADDAPEQLMTLSLVRAHFIDAVVQLDNSFKGCVSGFLTGALSLMDAILKQEKNQAFEQIPVQPDIKQAILSRSGKLGELLDLVEYFEKAKWSEVETFADNSILDKQQLETCYRSSLHWADTIIHQS